MKQKQYISTLEAARMCGVSTFSIQRWFDERRLVGARLPGGKRRIEAESLKAFMVKHGLAVATGYGGTKRKVMLIGENAKQMKSLRETILRADRYLVEMPADTLAMGISLNEFKPEVIVICGDLGHVTREEMIRGLKRSGIWRPSRIVVVGEEPASAVGRALRTAGANRVIGKVGQALKLITALG